MMCGWLSGYMGGWMDGLADKYMIVEAEGKWIHGQLGWQVGGQRDT